MEFNASLTAHLLIAFLLRSHAEDLSISSLGYYIFLTAYWINGPHRVDPPFSALYAFSDDVEWTSFVVVYHAGDVPDIVVR